MRNSNLVGLSLVFFVILLIGGYFATNEQGFPVVRQVENPAASALDATDSQIATLALVVVGLFALIGGMGSGLALLFYMLSRQVKKAVEGDPNPFAFSLNPKGNSIGALIQQNTFMVIFTGGILLIVIFIALVVLTGAF